MVLHATGGHWDFPKGHSENNESPIDTAIREVLEETGYNVKIIPGFSEQIVYSLNMDTRKIVTFYLAIEDMNVFSGAKNHLEISQVRWCNYKQARDTLTYQNSILLLTQAHKFIEGPIRQVDQ